MLTSETDLPATVDYQLAERLVERCCRSVGLNVKMKSSLSQYPGSVHWHFKKGTERGTLEVTLWRRGRRLWFSVQDGRTGVWIQDAIAQLKSMLERQLNETASQRRNNSYVNVPER